MFKLCHVQEKLIPFSSIYKIFFKSQKMSKIYNAIDLSIILSRILPNNTRVVCSTSQKKERKASQQYSKTSPHQEKEMKMQRLHHRIDLQFFFIDLVFRVRFNEKFILGTLGNYPQYLQYFSIKRRAAKKIIFCFSVCENTFKKMKLHRAKTR